MWSGVATTPEVRREIGARALGATRIIPEEAHIRAATANIGGLNEWPDQPLALVAVNVEDGTRRVFDRSQGVPIPLAVAASTSLPGRVAPITIDGRRYTDGGVYGTNLDVAAGQGVIVLLAPGTRRSGYRCRAGCGRG